MKSVAVTDKCFIETECLFCKDGEDSVLFPPRLHLESVDGYTFSARRERKREHYQIVICKKCGMVRSNPILADNKLTSLYKESRFIFSEEAPFAAQTYADLLMRLLDKNAGGGIDSLLEIGCSTGFFLEKARQLGIHEVVGFEPSEDCCKYAPESVRPLIINDIYRPELLAGRVFDLVCSFHVFDHLTEPRKALSSALDHLKPRGYVLLVCHDVESPGAKLLGDFNPIFDIEHVYLFSKKTMSNLLTGLGLTVIEVGSLSNTYPLGYWMRMTPLLSKCLPLLPGVLRKIPVSLRAGNLYAFARKDR